MATVQNEKKNFVLMTFNVNFVIYDNDLEIWPK